MTLRAAADGSTLRAEFDATSWAAWTLALFTVAAHGLMFAGGSLGPWLLPAAGAGAALLRRPQPPTIGLLASGICLAAAAMIAYGAVATTDRIWDGFTTWTANARRLALDGTLRHPWFVDRDVYVSARGYPLLQPALLAQTMQWLGERGGRLLFVGIWAAMVAGLARGLQQSGLAPRLRDGAVVGLALVPAFVEGGEGGADSGYADLLVAAVLLHAAVAVAGNRALAAALAGVALPLCKAEGAMLAMILVAVASLAGRRRAALGLATGAAIALALWTPVQQRLLAPGGAATTALALRPLAPLAIAGVGVALRRVPLWMGLVVVAAVAAGLAASGAFGNSSIGRTAQRLASLDLDWSAMPRILGRLAIELLSPREVGFTFVMLAVTGCLAARRRRLGDAAPLLAAIALGLVAIVAFVASKPGDQLDGFLRHGIGRYLSQWLGVAWLACGLMWAKMATTTPSSAA